MGEAKRFIKGLFKDTGHIDQPEGSWRYALNAVINTVKGALSNEKGTLKNGEIVPNWKVIGAIEISGGRVVLFSTLLSSDINHEIGVWEDGEYRSILRPDTGQKKGLNFSIHNPIEGVFKIDAKGDLVVYFTDDLNPARAFNVSRQERFLEETTLVEPAAIKRVYGIHQSNSHDNHIDILNLFPSSGPVPTITFTIDEVNPPIVEGGGLLTAAYYLALAYVDEDLVATNYLTVSNPVSIVEEFDSTRPTTKIDGAKEGSKTSKAVKWSVSNLNKVDYKYIRPVVIRKMGEASDVFKLNDLSIDLDASNKMEITFTGTEGVEAAALEEIVIDTIGYDTVKTISQLDDVLYLGNVTSNKDIGFQKYANNIKVSSNVKIIEDFDTMIASVDNFETGWGTRPVDSYGVNSDVQIVDDTKSYRSSDLNYKFKSYMRDEVYGLYIAFVYHDGSETYGYHIPGRAPSGDELIPLGNHSLEGYSNLDDLGPYAKSFHVQDTSVSNPESMNYWHNASEFYPDNDNFDVMDGITPLETLRNKEVRHHHFPGNANGGRSTILTSNVSTTDSAGTDQIGVDYAGEWTFTRTENGNVIDIPGTEWSAPHRFNVCTGTSVSGDITADEAMDVLMPSGNSFVAPGPMTITNIDWKIWYHRYDQPNMSGSSACAPLRTKVIVEKGIDIFYIDYDRILNWGGTGANAGDAWNEDINWNAGSGLNEMFDDSVSYAPAGSAFPIDLNAGDKITVLGRGHWGADVTNRGVRQAKDSETTAGNKSYIKITIASNDISTPSLKDASISHDVSALGFDLKDIKIPASYKSQIQGFRIYRAERSHENKTILGQGLMLPMKRKANIIGMCVEANAAPEAQQILGSLQASPEIFYNKDPWPSPASDYAVEGGHSVGEYKAFSFHDFHLLRTKSSLAPATHVSAQYAVSNLVWNGPTVHQDKKMVTRLKNHNSATEPIEIRETWGYDTEFNCYPSMINSAVFIGNKYTNFSVGQEDADYAGFPKLIGQKAKTYLLGDSIFSGQSLGFGGKVFNEFGESTTIFSLRDGFHLTALVNSPDGVETDKTDFYGYPHNNTPSILVNDEEDVSRSNGYIINIDAFKTDIYKSIDSQRLVFTGYEVMGEDLDSFFFDDDSESSTYGEPSSAEEFSDNQYSTAKYFTEGIYGGDTFISRYGFVSTLTPSNPEDTSNPRRAIHFHIVESPDNISLRHTEDDDSLYFPGSPAKQLLKYGGRDFSHTDNMKYNADYSRGNNIRSAFPLPLRDTNQSDFPTRAHRSVKASASSLIDNYRIFLASQYKDLPKNRGELWKLSSFSNLLYFHMEDSLFAAKGKQSMKMADGSAAYVGSGDIFEQAPDEVIQTELGYGGTQSQWATLTTRYGYFYPDLRSKKVFLMGEKLQEISLLGMEKWFRDNLRYKIEDYGYNAPLDDNPIHCMGLHSTWDPLHKKIMLTMREPTPTQEFKDGYNIGLVNQDITGAIYWDEDLQMFMRTSSGIAPPASTQMYNDMLASSEVTIPTFNTVGIWDIDIYAALIDSIGIYLGGEAVSSHSQYFTSNVYPEVGVTNNNTLFHWVGEYEDSVIGDVELEQAGYATMMEYIPEWLETNVANGNIDMAQGLDLAALNASLAPGSNLTVGDLYGGGRVFYIDEATNTAYISALHVPTTDSPCGVYEFGGHQLQSAYPPIPGVTTTELGAGYFNTLALVGGTPSLLVGQDNSGEVGTFGVYCPSQEFVDSSLSIAASAAQNFTNTETGTGTFSDWFLPSLSEFNVLKTNVGSYYEEWEEPSVELYYWTSSESANDARKASAINPSMTAAIGLYTPAAEFIRTILLRVLPIRTTEVAVVEPEEVEIISEPVVCDNSTYFDRGGWTVSYYPETNMWGSFHSYVPYLYFNTVTNFYSFTDRGAHSTENLISGSSTGYMTDRFIWKHNSGAYGEFYDGGVQTLIVNHRPHILDWTNVQPFEVEFIHNETKNEDTLTSSIGYNIGVQTYEGSNLLHGGFTSFFVYNNLQMSLESEIEYLVNTRKIGNDWKLNRFRDMSKLLTNTSPYFMSLSENIIGSTNVGTETTTSNLMFLTDGMREIPNSSYLDADKIWNKQKKFVDRWVGIRLICDNSQNNSLNLYTSSREVRKFYR